MQHQSFYCLCSNTFYQGYVEEVLSSADTGVDSTHHCDMALQAEERSADEEGLQLVLNRLKALEQENDGPERRELLKRRKKQLKDILSQHKDYSGRGQPQALLKRFEQEVKPIQSFSEMSLPVLVAQLGCLMFDATSPAVQYHERTRLDAEMISLRKKHDAAVKGHTQGAPCVSALWHLHDTNLTFRNLIDSKSVMLP